MERNRDLQGCTICNQQSWKAIPLTCPLSLPNALPETPLNLLGQWNVFECLRQGFYTSPQNTPPTSKIAVQCVCKDNNTPAWVTEGGIEINGCQDGQCTLDSDCKWERSKMIKRRMASFFSDLYFQNCRHVSGVLDTFATKICTRVRRSNVNLTTMMRP